MEDLYKELGLQPNASVGEIAQAAAAHPGKKAAGAILQDALRKAEYDRAYRALHEIGTLRAGLTMQSAHWREEQQDFVQDEQAGAAVRRNRAERKGNSVFFTLLGFLLVILLAFFAERDFQFSSTILSSQRSASQQIDTTSGQPRSTAPSQPRDSTPALSSDAWKKMALSNIASFGDKYYKVFDSSRISTVDSWESAYQFCRQNHGQLAVIESAAENAFIYAWLQSQKVKEVYFGLTDRGHEGEWRSLSKGKATYLNWAPGEPNNEFGKEHYAMFYHRSPPELWNDGTPGKGFLFICQWENPQQFQAYEKLMGGRAVNIHKERRNLRNTPIGTPQPESGTKARPSVEAQQSATKAQEPAALSLDLTGVYTGSYRAGQGTTGLTLKVDKRGGRYIAVFEFYPVNRKKTASNSGKYRMDVSLDPSSGEIVMIGREWILQPILYQFVHLRGRIDGDRYTGIVFTDTGTTQWRFAVSKKKNN